MCKELPALPESYSLAHHPCLEGLDVLVGILILCLPIVSTIPQRPHDYSLLMHKPENGQSCVSR